MGPDQPDEWLHIARVRGADAEAIVDKNPTSVGAVYMAGYAVECSLKALLQIKGIERPRKGAEGHNLRALWAKSGLRLTDLHDETGAKAFFISDWSTDLRYESDLAKTTGITTKELLDGAAKLASWLNTQVKRSKTRPRR